MLAGALLLVAQPATAISSEIVPGIVPCPAARIGFAPPLDTPLLLTRTIQRELARGHFVQTVRYHVTFARAGRGYAMHWRQIGQTADGPAELLRLLSLQEAAAEGEVLDFTLDSQGALLGMSESPESPQRLARAIARLRTDPAFVRRPDRERLAITGILDRLEQLPPEERARIQMAKASRLLVFAGQPCAAGRLSARDGHAGRIMGAGDDWLNLAGSDGESQTGDAPASTTFTARLSLRTGLVETQQRTTVSTLAGSSRTSRESLSLQPAAPAAK